MEERRKENILDCARIVDKHNIMLLKIVKWLIISNIILSILFFASNMAWLYAANQYEYEYVELDSGIDGNANYIGESGVIVNGESNCGKKEK